jgi:hypothetical protein
MPLHLFLCILLKHLTSPQPLQGTVNSSIFVTLYQSLATTTMHLFSFLLIAAFSLVYGQVVSPYPVSDCSGLAGTELQCPNQPGCCSGGAICCAGGCCPLSTTCVNSGTSDEKCCDVSDKSLCGAAVTHLVRLRSCD